MFGSLLVVFFYLVLEDNKALVSSSKNQKLFKIPCHIKSYGTCMEH